MGNVQKFREGIMAPSFVHTDGTSVGSSGATVTGTPTIDAGVSAWATITEAPMPVQRMVLTLAALEATISTTGNFVALKIGSFGGTTVTRPIVIIGARTTMAFVKDGGGAITTTDLDYAIGSTAATSGVFSLPQRDIITKQDINDDTLTPSVFFQDYSNLSSVTVLDFPNRLAGNDIYLNLGGNIGSDALITLTGSVEIFYFDFGTPA